MAEKLLILSIRFWHPIMHSKSIIDEFKLEPDVINEVGQKRVLKNGVEFGEGYTETYVAFEFLKSKDTEIPFAIEKANELLKQKMTFIKNFINTGGRFDYYISIVCEKWFAFELSPKLIDLCAKLGVTLGVEFFADLERTNQM